MSKLVLASGSPRRREIMSKEGHEFVIIKAEGEEYSDAETSSEYVSDLSRDKGMEVYGKVCGHEAEYGLEVTDGEAVFILAADTVVSLDNKNLGKPSNEEEAARMIRSISGRSHSVYTGVTIVKYEVGSEGYEVKTFFDETLVHVKSLTEQEIADYVSLGECMDKAGAYAIQGEFGQYIEGFEGDYRNVVGLPYEKVYDALKELDY